MGDLQLGLKLKDPGICRIFFSSPFGGMEGEREELTRKYFPQIHHLCNQYGVTFVAVDLRWGITTEASATSQVINICLRELDRSDFFVGFFGQRYGWHGRDDKSLQENFENAIGRYPWLENFRNKSVTELEFLHGHLNNPGALPAVICFRNKEHDEKEREKGQEKGDKKQVFKYSAESVLSTQLLEDLKQRCYHTKEKTYGVHLSYPDPAEGAKIMFDAIWKYLKQVLPKQQMAETETKRSKLLAQHDAFLASRQKMFGLGDTNLTSLLSLISKECPAPLLLIGPSGCGKSTLLSLFISRVSSEYRSQFALAYHCVGHAEESTDPGQILQRLADEIEYAFDVMEGREETTATKKKKVEDVRDIINQLAAGINKIQSKGKQCIIIIDGVDKVPKASRTEEILFWLPRKLPEGTIMIVSAASSEAEVQEELLTNRSFDMLEIQDLSEEMRQDFCVKMLMEAGKELSSLQMTKIVQSNGAKNTLFLKVLLNELIVFGYFRLLDQKIDSLAKTQSVDELFEKVLERLETDYKESDYEGNLVEQVMCVLCLSRMGMTEAELTNMFSIPSHIWSPFFFSVENYFIDQRGLIQFGFQEFKNAVKRKYLQDENQRKKYVECIAHYFEDQKQKLPKLFSEHNNELARISSELPFAYHFLQDTEKLAETLTNLPVLSYLINQKQYITELYDLWEFTSYTWSRITEKYFAAVDLQIADVYILEEEEGKLDQQKPGLLVVDDLWNIFSLLNYVHYFDGCEKVLWRILDINEKTCKSVDKAKNLRRERALYHIATTYHNNSKLQKSIEMHLQVLEIRKMRVPDILKANPEDLELLGTSYNGIGTNYLMMADYTKAEEFFKKSLECAEIAKAKENMSSCYLNLSSVYTAMQDYLKAVECIEKAIQLTKEVYFGQQPLALGLLYNNMGLCCRRMNRIDEAEKYYQMSISVKRNTVGDHHPLLCQTYASQSVIESLRGHEEKALEYNQLAMEICRKNGTPENDSMYAKCRENVTYNLINLKRMEDAVELYLPFFDVLEEEMNNGSVHLIDGTLPHVHAGIVNHLIQNGQYEVARKILKAFIKTKAFSPLDFVLLGDVNGMLDPGDQEPKFDWNEGAMSIDDALQKWPADHSLLVYKFRNLINAGSSAALIKTFNDMCSGPYNYDSLLNFVLEMFATSENFNNKLFLEFNLNGLTHVPKSEFCTRNIAESYEREKRPEKALEYYKMWTEQDQDNPYPYYKVSCCSALSGNIEEAKEYCSKAREKAEKDNSDQSELAQKISSLWNLLEEAQES